MRKEALIGLSVLLVAVSGSATVLDSFGVVSGEASVEPALRVSEVLYNPSGEDSGHEKLEVYNPSDSPVDLTAFEISDGEESETLTSRNDTDTFTDYAIIIENDYDGDFKQDELYFEVDDGTIGSNLLPNSDEESLRISKGDLLIDEVTINGECDEGGSAQRDSVYTDSLSCDDPNFGEGGLE